MSLFFLNHIGFKAQLIAITAAYQVRQVLLVKGKSLI